MDETTDKTDAGDATLSALRTLAFEKKGLDALAEALENGLGEPFEKAVALLRQTQGHVIVSGVGKSGHVGTKIAATFASTGTPAFFVHPAEANHGDMGMIAQKDAVVALSWSGESSELTALVAYTRRFAIPLIAITAGKQSSLALAADVVLSLPKAEEACPLGLAPTTSTTMQLAIGDALAIALLEVRGFSAVDFKVYHPGGKLGALLSHVADIMHVGEEIPLVRTGTPLPEAIMELSKRRFGCVGVIDDDGRLAGIVTDGDLARNLSRDMSALAVDDVMTAGPKTVRQTMMVSGALALIHKHNISALMVVDEDNHPVGIVHFHDFLRIGAA
ncbi:KpsF/GutQ family sugar-phosphate isomerase [Martelella lutilitoris]|uniref:KpsF/GutQ family sugar-phosphate isomerase n=1 Tax=Martelella lutilitoris TaxID=2583532 RepID=A0A5C4JQF6_9HYPH|nr:KpsF/GutQ family sugar-phosphate isomerase [Martelella lutilitoris]TNB47705.1 KpsF/GutQ family sugar-phosphate isomerase [Martelella lutilitoris]